MQPGGPLEIITAKANAGDANAQYHLALLCEYGPSRIPGMQRDPVNALAFYKKAAEQGHKQAKSRLADKTFVQETEDLERLMKAAVDGNPDGALHFARFLEKRGEKNHGLSSAIKFWYREAKDFKAETDFEAKEERERLLQHFQWFDAAAKRGDPRALISLAQFFEHGYGVVKIDLRKAIDCCSRAALKNYAGASQYLAHLKAKQQAQQSATVKSSAGGTPEGHEAKGGHEQNPASAQSSGSVRASAVDVHDSVKRSNNEATAPVYRF